MNCNSCEYKDECKNAKLDFEVGDIVRVVRNEESKCSHGFASWDERRDQCLGKIYEIVNIQIRHRLKMYLLKNDPCDYIWCSCWLERVKE